MSVPAVGNVQVPSGFVCLSAQGQVLLSWNYTPLATIYYISRSTDGVTFADIGSTTALSFNDGTGDLNVVYYYYIQAGNGTNSSVPTYSLTAQSLKPGQTTVGNVKLEVLQRIDKVNSQYYTQQELNSMINQSYKEFYDIIIQHFADEYYEATPYTWTLESGTSLYALPDDFYKNLLVDIALNNSDPNSFVTLREYQKIQENLYNYPNVYTFYGVTNLRYRITGNYIKIVPAPQGGQTLRMQYVPRPDQLVSDSDVIDCVSGWEEYITVDVCIKALAKEESDPTVFALQKQALLKRIEEAAENRNIAEPERVSDVRRINFAWQSEGEGGNGYG